MGWDSWANMLAVAVVSFIMAFIATRVSIGETFVNLLLGFVTAPVTAALYTTLGGLSLVAQPTQYIRTWVDGLEIGFW